MTDLDRMKEMFQEMGVHVQSGIVQAFTEHDQKRSPVMSARMEGRPGTYLVVAKAHFVFDHADRFVGVISDEMGDFYEREN